MFKHTKQAKPAAVVVVSIGDRFGRYSQVIKVIDISPAF